MKRTIVLGLAVLAYGSTTQAFEMATVTVGNPGNPGDTRYPDPPVTSFGGVAYVYNIGTFEVTAGHYRDFLNAVDPAGSNPYGLYSELMVRTRGCMITWNAGSSTYDFSGSPSGAEADWVDRPVNLVSWGDAARFCNWLHNGQPTGQLTGDPTQDAGLTEDGSYYLNGATTDGALLAIVREPGATWVIPSEDEWYKAAYHYNDGVTGNYYDYPTSSDSVPSNDLVEPIDPGNNATFYDSGYTIGIPYCRTEGGAHENSDSPYETFDQGGNVWEWNEAVLYGSYRGLRGGSFAFYDIDLHAASRSYDDPADEYVVIGFRVADVSEPAPTDTDGDGIPDEDDACPESDLSETIFIDGCDTGVDNLLFDDGCTMADRIAECADAATSHGEFVACVAALTNEWKNNGLISGKEKGRIQRCAAHTKPSTSKRPTLNTQRRYSPTG